MAKSGRRKKGGGTKNHGLTDNSSANANSGLGLETSILLKKAHELKEEGNKRFQGKDYGGALEEYDKAMKLIPIGHRERAVFHSNRAACLMQIKPVDYEAVISECSMALHVQPLYVKALLRRARALEFIGKHEIAMQDIQVLLRVDPNNKDALEIARRLRTSLVPQQDAEQDLPSRPSPAAVGASAVRGAPVAAISPCLPPKSVNKKEVSPTGRSVELNNVKLEKPRIALGIENVGSRQNLVSPTDSFKPSCEQGKGDKKGKSLSPSKIQRSTVVPVKGVVKSRPLKLVYDHDVRLAEMPVNCTFRAVREIVGRRFPSSKAVLIKYKDSDGDLVTITSNKELRLAELSVDQSENGKGDHISMIRLHVVEVSPEQEPSLPEEEDQKAEAESPLQVCDSEREEQGDRTDKEKDVVDNECRELEIDDWLFDFAQLFRAHVGVDPEAHFDLQEIGMELLSDAIEETVTCEEAQTLFDKAAMKFQEIAALAFFNWGNVYMCAARKRIPLGESGGKKVIDANFDVAYNWVKGKYVLASEKYNEALRIKPDFYEGLLALGQQEFEMAKLLWSYALSKKVDLSHWDSTGIFELFSSAEVKMKAATEMWMKMEEERENELKNTGVRGYVGKRRKKKNEGSESEKFGLSVVGAILADEAAEQAAIMTSQMHLFWANMLYERSQVEYKLGLSNWKENLDSAVERFKLAGGSDEDMALVLKNHFSNLDAGARDEVNGEESSLKSSD